MLRDYFLGIVILIGSILFIAFLLPVLAEPTEVASSRSLDTPVTVSGMSESKTHKTTRLKLFSGIASWYGNPFHGRRTASGQIFDMNKLTAAHLTLPLSSRVLVKNPHNGKVVVITVNDRGPYIKNRVIDLSREAAKQLGILSIGIAYVNYAVLPSEAQPEGLSGSRNAMMTDQ